jgi:hypothetical protein
MDGPNTSVSFGGRITVRLVSMGLADNWLSAGSGARSFRCEPGPARAGNNGCPAGTSGKVGQLTLVMDDYPSSSVRFGVTLDAGGSCTFTGRVPFFDTRPIPAMSGTYSCIDAAGTATDSGKFVLGALDSAPRRNTPFPF